MTMRKIEATLLFCFLFSVLSLAPIGFSQVSSTKQKIPPTPAGPPFLQQAKSYEVTQSASKVVFKNGLTVLVSEFRSQPVFTAKAIVRTGYLNDPAGNPGINRLLAAIICRGAPSKNAGSFRQSLQAVGGVLKSETRSDATEFEISASSQQWKKALGAFGEAITNPSFDPEIIKTEATFLQAQVESELKDPYNIAKVKALRAGASFENGNSAAIPKISRESLVILFKSAYAPDGITIVVTGDVSTGEVFNEIAMSFGKNASSYAAGQISLPEKRKDGFRYEIIRGVVEVPRLIFAFKTPADTDADYDAVEILSAMLGVGDGAMLPFRLKDQKQFSYLAEARIELFPKSSYLFLDLEASPGNIDKCEIGVLTEIELIKKNTPSDVDMERARAQLARRYWDRMETAAGRAEKLAYYQLAGNWKRWESRITELRKVKPEEIQQAAIKHLRLDNCLLLEFLPASLNERTIAQEAAKSLFEGLLPSSIEQEEAKRAKESAYFVKIPSDEDAFQFDEIRHPIQIASLLRGPDVFIKEDHTSPLVQVGLFFPGGKLDENKENSGITRLMLRALLEEDKSKTPGFFHKQMEIYGGSVTPIVADDYFGFHFCIESRNFEAGYNLLQETIRAHVFDKEKTVWERELQLADIAREKRSDNYAKHLIYGSIFQNFPYAFNSNGNAGSVEKITTESLQNWHEQHIKNRKPIIVAIGDTKGTSMASYFAKGFSGSRMLEAKAPTAFAPAPDQETSVEQKWNTPDSIILVGFQAPPVDDEDVYATTALAGYIGGSGLFVQELRDRLGVASDISAIYAPRLRGGSLVICARAVQGNEESLLKALLERIKKLGDSPVPSRDFQLAINLTIGMLDIERQQRFVQIDGIAKSVLQGKGFSEYTGFKENLRNVSEEEINAVIKKFINLDKAAIAVVRGSKS